MLSRIAVREPPYSAPTYEQISTRIASLACSLIVSVVSSAIASVADSPGRMPITMPTKAPPRSTRPCIVRPAETASGQAHQEQVLEHPLRDERCRDADDDRLHGRPGR